MVAGGFGTDAVDHGQGGKSVRHGMSTSGRRQCSNSVSIRNGLRTIVKNVANAGVAVDHVAEVGHPGIGIGAVVADRHKGRCAPVMYDPHRFGRLSRTRRSAIR